MRISKDDKYKKMKKFIYKKFLNNIKNINSIIELIDILEKADKETFLKELMKIANLQKKNFIQPKKIIKQTYYAHFMKRGKSMKSLEKYKQY